MQCVLVRVSPATKKKLVSTARKMDTSMHGVIAHLLQGGRMPKGIGYGTKATKKAGTKKPAPKKPAPKKGK